MKQQLPFVSLLVVCKNEAPFIEKVLLDLLNQSYPKEQLEILVIDGMSDDGTRSIVQKIARENSSITLVDNKRQNVPSGLNYGIGQSRGEYIIRFDAHATYPQNYVAALIEVITRTGADVVGSTMQTKAQQSSFWASSIVGVLTHPLGVGDSQFRIGVEGEHEVDTVPFGCFKRDVFDRFGSYNERLLRNQDIELNKRIKSGGGKILITSNTHCTYLSRSSLGPFFKNKFWTGRWVIRTASITKKLGSLSLRHFVPLGFVLYMLSLPFFALASSWFLIPGVIYFLLIGISALMIVVKENRITSFFSQVFVFIGLHISYGLGSLMGILDVLLKRKF